MIRYTPTSLRRFGFGAALTLALIVVSASPCAANSLDGYARRVFGAVHEKLGEILTYYDRHENLPDSTPWYQMGMGEDKESNAKAMRGLVEQTLELLDVSDVTGRCDRYRELGQTIQQAHGDIDQYRRDKIPAPEKSLWRKTADDYDELIAEAESRIEETKKKQAKLIGDIRDELTKMGLRVTDKQVRFFLASVSGDSFIELSAVFHNVRQINEQLAELSRESSEHAATAKRYYGMHLMLIRILIQAHDEAIRKLDRVYAPKLRNLRKRNEALSEETRELLQKSKAPAARALLRSNLAAQKITADAAALYLRHLENEVRKLEARRKVLEAKFDVAENTYRTAKVAADLVSLINTSLADLTSLRDMRLPELLPFQNAELQRKFQELTRRIRSE